MKNKIEIFRNYQDMSIEDLAIKTKINIFELRGIELGSVTPSKGEQQRIATALGCSINCLF